MARYIQLRNRHQIPTRSCPFFIFPDKSVWSGVQVCQPNSPLFSNESGKYCFARNFAPGDIFSKLVCQSPPTTSTLTSTSTLTPTSTSMSTSTSTIPANECGSEACWRFSNLIRSKMKTSIDPCHDFYRFSCGSATRSSYEEMEEIVGKRVEKILTDVNAGRHPWTQALISFFKSCQTRFLGDNVDFHHVVYFPGLSRMERNRWRIFWTRSCQLTTKDV